MSAEESIRIWQSAGPLKHGALHTGNIGDDRASPDDGGKALEDHPDLVDWRRDHDDVAVGHLTQIRRCSVDRTALLRRQHPILVMGGTAHFDGPTEPAQGQAERSADQAEPDDADPHHATPTVRLSAAATASTCSRSEEHTSELQSRENLVCRLLLQKKKKKKLALYLHQKKKKKKKKKQ